MKREVKEFYLGVVDEVNTELAGLGETNKKVSHLEDEIDKVKKFCLALNDKLKSTTTDVKEPSNIPNLQKNTAPLSAVTNTPGAVGPNTPEQVKRAKGRPPGSGNKNKLLQATPN
jgi:hypothetical protein